MRFVGRLADLSRLDRLMHRAGKVSEVAHDAQVFAIELHGRIVGNGPDGADRYPFNVERKQKRMKRVVISHQSSVVSPKSPDVSHSRQSLVVVVSP